MRAARAACVCVSLRVRVYMRGAHTWTPRGRSRFGKSFRVAAQNKGSRAEFESSGFDAEVMEIHSDDLDDFLVELVNLLSDRTEHDD